MITRSRKVLITRSREVTINRSRVVTINRSRKGWIHMIQILIMGIVEANGLFKVEGLVQKRNYLLVPRNGIKNLDQGCVEVTTVCLTI